MPSPVVVPRIAQLPDLGGDRWSELPAELAMVNFGRVETAPGKTDPAVQVSIGYSEKEFYARFSCAEPELNRMKTAWSDPVANRDAPVYSDDCVELFLAPDPADWNSYVEIVANSRGVVYDARCEGVAVTDAGWSSECRVKTRVVGGAGTIGGRWLAEMTIPFSAVGGPPLQGAYWLVNFTRIRSVEGSVDYSWVPLSGSFHRPDLFQPLFFGKAGAIPPRRMPVVALTRVLPAVRPEAWKASVTGLTAFAFGKIAAGGNNPYPAVRAFLCHDAAMLYALFVCAEPELERVVASRSDAVKDRDGPLWSDDCVELYLATDPDTPDAYYQIIVNSKGVVLDGLWKNPGAMDKTWDSRVTVRTYRVEGQGQEPGCWLAELKVPFSSFGERAGPAAGWKINLTRQRKVGRPTEYTCVPLAGSFHQPRRFMPIKFQQEDK